MTNYLVVAFYSEFGMVLSRRMNLNFGLENNSISHSNTNLRKKVEEFFKKEFGDGEAPDQILVILSDTVLIHWSY